MPREPVIQTRAWLLAPNPARITRADVEAVLDPILRPDEPPSGFSPWWRLSYDPRAPQRSDVVLVYLLEEGPGVAYTAGFEPERPWKRRGVGAYEHGLLLQSTDGPPPVGCVLMRASRWADLFERWRPGDVPSHDARIACFSTWEGMLDGLLAIDGAHAALAPVASQEENPAYTGEDVRAFVLERGPTWPEDAYDRYAALVRIRMPDGSVSLLRPDNHRLYYLRHERPWGRWDTAPWKETQNERDPLGFDEAAPVGAIHLGGSDWWTVAGRPSVPWAEVFPGGAVVDRGHEVVRYFDSYDAMLDALVKVDETFSSSAKANPRYSYEDVRQLFDQVSPKWTIGRPNAIIRMREPDGTLHVFRPDTTIIDYEQYGTPREAKAWFAFHPPVGGRWDEWDPKAVALIQLAPTDWNRITGHGPYRSDAWPGRAIQADARHRAFDTYDALMDALVLIDQALHADYGSARPKRGRSQQNPMQYTHHDVRKLVEELSPKWQLDRFNAMVRLREPDGSLHLLQPSTHGHVYIREPKSGRWSHLGPDRTMRHPVWNEWDRTAVGMIQLAWRDWARVVGVVPAEDPDVPNVGPPWGLHTELGAIGRTAPNDPNHWHRYFDSYAQMCQGDPWGLDHPGTLALLVDSAWKVYELSGSHADLRRYLAVLSRMEIEQLAEAEGLEAADAFRRKNRDRVESLFGDVALFGRLARIVG